MPFNISEFVDKGFTTLVALAAVYFVLQLGRIFTKYIPIALKQAKEFAVIWRDFVGAVDSNATAIEKNTQVVDLNFKHSTEVLSELVGFKEIFELHDNNALELKESVLQLIKVIEQGDNSEEVLALLQYIVKRMEEQETQTIAKGEKR